MERVTVRGNSLGRGLRIEGVEVISRGGAKLGELMDAAERERREGSALTIFIFGIPDLLRRGETQRWRREDREGLLRSIRRAKGRKDWVLATVFPPRNATHEMVMCFRGINKYITEVNGENHNGTVDLHNIMFYREGTRYIVKKDLYSDLVHWNEEAKRMAEGKVGRFTSVWRGRRSGRLEVQRETIMRQAEGEVRRAREKCEEEIEEYAQRRRGECEREEGRVMEEAGSKVDRLRERLDEDRGEAGAGSRGNELGVRVRPEEERREERFQEGVEDLRARIGRGQERMIPLRY
jgi:hypothetical protein